MLPFGEIGLEGKLPDTPGWTGPISFPEPSLPLSCGTGKRDVPLDNGNEGSGNEIK